MYCLSFWVRPHVLLNIRDGFDKTYVAECKFGTFTDTEDSTGQPVLPDDEMKLAEGITLLDDFSVVNDLLIPPTWG